MKKKANKLKAVALCTSLVLAGALAGCQGGSKPAAESTAGGTQAEAAAQGESGAAGTDAGTADAAAAGKIGNGEVLKVGIRSSNFVDDYNDNYFTKLLEEECNIDIEFYELPQDGNELNMKMSLLASNGADMPDVILSDSFTREMILDYGNKGVFVPLNEYIENEAISPNWMNIPQEDREQMLKAMVSADGNIYGLPRYAKERWNLTPYRYYLNSAWLEKLGLAVPTTTDELYTVLKAFAEQDPNGNGVKDEIPMYGFALGGYGENSVWALMNSFVFYNGGKDGGTNGGLALAQDGKTVVAPFVTDEWRQGLSYMAKLNQEGLLASSMFTDDNTQFKATLNAETPIVGLVTTGSFGVWADANNNKNFLEMDVVAPFAGPNGVNYTPYNSYTPPLAFFVTSSCKNPELAYRFGEYFYNYDISRTARYGEKGVDWTDDPEACAANTNAEVEAGLAEKVNLLYNYKSPSNVWSSNTTKFWHDMGPRYAPDTVCAADGQIPYDPAKKANLAHVRNRQYYSDLHPDQVLPTLHYTTEEAEVVAMPMTDITEFIRVSTAEFITGQRSLDDAGWDEYVKTLESLGLSDLIATAQGAYDRMASE